MWDVAGLYIDLSLTSLCVSGMRLDMEPLRTVNDEVNTADVDLNDG